MKVMLETESSGEKQSTSVTSIKLGLKLEEEEEFRIVIKSRLHTTGISL